VTALERIKGKVNRTSRLVRKGATQRLRALVRPGAHKQVAFVAGVQRSGTNMMMDVLECSPHTEVFHERDTRAFEGFELRPRDVLHDLVRSSPASYVVLKALCEVEQLRSLLDEFAPAKAVWIVRAVDDVVNSHLVLWKRMPEFVAAIVKDRDAARWRGRGMSDETHALVKRLYHPELSNASACALFWYFRNVLFFEQGLDADPRVRAVRYEALVTDPVRESAAIFAFLGLPYTGAVSRTVRSGSVRKQVPPRVDPAIREVCGKLAARFDEVLASEAATSGALDGR
jgi:hypothetical protein